MSTLIATLLGTAAPRSPHHVPKPRRAETMISRIFIPITPKIHLCFDSNPAPSLRRNMQRNNPVTTNNYNILQAHRWGLPSPHQNWYHGVRQSKSDELNFQFPLPYGPPNVTILKNPARHDRIHNLISSKCPFHIHELVRIIWKH